MSEPARITIDQVTALVRRSLPIAEILRIRVEEIEYGRAKVRLPFGNELVRPGGTVAGPALMGVADFAMYVAVMSRIGPVEGAVTANLNINFLRKPAPRDVIAEAVILRSGRRLAVAEVGLYSEGESEMVAHVTGSYSIPQPPVDQR